VASISYKRHRFPKEVIQHAVWLYFRFTLSLRDVEEMLAQRGIEVSYETIRCWTIKFGAKIATNLRRRKAPPSPRWHLDEMVSSIGGERVYIWRAVDDEGEGDGHGRAEAARHESGIAIDATFAAQSTRRAGDNHDGRSRWVR
jgi:putative transposase